MIVYVIARNTAREAIRNKVLYSILLFAFLMVGACAILGAASIGDEMKFIKDFSLFGISIFGVVTTVVLGVNLLQKELGRRTIINILSKPVARWQFILGKYFGLLTTVALLVAVMSAALLAAIYAMSGELDLAMLWASGAILMELAMLLAVAIFFSAIVVTPTLAGLFTVATFIAGRSSSYLGYFQSEGFPVLLQRLSSMLHVILPPLDRYWIADEVVYRDALSPWYFGHLGVYAVAYCGLVLMISMVLFHYREFT